MGWRESDVVCYELKVGTLMTALAETPILNDTKIIHSADAVACDLGDETAILHLETGIYFGLDAVSSRIWTLLSEEISLQQLVSQLLQVYDVSRERCESEVIDLLATLAEYRLIEIRHAPLV
jgi:hypothetical protein